MRNRNLKSLLCLVFVICMIANLSACSSVLDKLPPLPTPSDGAAEPAADPFAEPALTPAVEATP